MQENFQGGDDCLVSYAETWPPLIRGNVKVSTRIVPDQQLVTAALLKAIRRQNGNLKRLPVLFGKKRHVSLSWLHVVLEVTMAVTVVSDPV